MYLIIHPIIVYIESNGIKVDITPAMQKIIDNVVKKVYSSNKKIHWMKIYVGEKASRICGNQWLLEETLDAIKCPLTTAVGTGIRWSLNVRALELDNS